MRRFCCKMAQYAALLRPTIPSPAEEAPRAGDLAGAARVVVVDERGAAGAGPVDGAEAPPLARAPAAARRHARLVAPAADGDTAEVVDDFDHVPLRRQPQAVAVPPVHLARSVDAVRPGRAGAEPESSGEQQAGDHTLH